MNFFLFPGEIDFYLPFFRIPLVLRVWFSHIQTILVAYHRPGKLASNNLMDYTSVALYILLSSYFYMYISSPYVFYGCSKQQLLLALKLPGAVLPQSLRAADDSLS